LLFGFSYLYGLSGTAKLPDAVIGAMQSDFPLLAILALLMVLGGLFFKTSVAPFHVWTPDVYQGSPTPFTGYLSVVSKAAGFAALMRIAAPVINLPALGDFREMAGDAISIDLRFVFALLAAATMTIGNFAALRQNNLKRLLAYSSIAHAGYMLMAFSNPSVDSFAAMMAYLEVYLYMNLGFFLAVVLMENDRNGAQNVSDYAGYGRQNPLLGGCLTIILVSLIGLPPTAGFIAKFELFATIIKEPGTGALLPWHTLLVIIALLNSVVSLAYYIRPAKVMFFDEPPATSNREATEKLGPSYQTLASLGMLAMTLPLFALLLWWGDMGMAQAQAAFEASTLAEFVGSL
jgi:NADH-quinone oxidoreductase subunit N